MKWLEHTKNFFKKAWRLIRPGWLLDWKKRRPMAEPPKGDDLTSELRGSLVKLDKDSQELSERLNKFINETKEDNDPYKFLERLTNHTNETKIADERSEEKRQTDNRYYALNKDFRIGGEFHWTICFSVMYRELNDKNLLHETHEDKNLNKFTLFLKRYMEYYIEALSTKKGFEKKCDFSQYHGGMKPFYKVLSTLPEDNPAREIFNAAVNVFFEYKTPMANSNKKLEEEFNGVKILFLDLNKDKKFPEARELLWGEIIQNHGKKAPSISHK